MRLAHSTLLRHVGIIIQRISHSKPAARIFQLTYYIGQGIKRLIGCLAWRLPRMTLNERLVKKVLVLFSTKGYMSTSITDILERTGSSKAEVDVNQTTGLIFSGPFGASVLYKPDKSRRNLDMTKNARTNYFQASPLAPTETDRALCT
jgi:hypothetical protein